MGNKNNRAPRRKQRISNLTKKKRILNLTRKSRIVNPTNDDTTDKSVVNVISVLCPTSDMKSELNDPLDPIATTIENDKEVSGSKEKSQFPYVDDTVKIKCEMELDIEPEPTEIDKQNLIELEIEPVHRPEPRPNPRPEPRSKSNEIMKTHKQNLIEFNNICRLCLTGKGSTWINIFSTQPYENCSDITPSNILEVIEQFTTIKISKNDRLPSKLCSSCFEALRNMHNFREKSLRSKKSLDSIIDNLRMHERKKVLVKVIQLKPIKRPILKEAIKRPILNEAIKRPILNEAIKRPILNESIERPTSMEEINRDENQENVSGEVQCEICGKVFERYQLLQYHLNIHNGVKPFLCTEPFCEKSFFSPKNRKTHINNVHCTAPKFKCDVCEKPYTTATKLNIHRTSHFPPTIPCKICGKLLRNQSSIRKHRASHTERLFKCDDCGKEFQKAYTLRVHRRIHTNEKPFVCCKCAEAFSYNCLLKAHMEKYHLS